MTNERVMHINQSLGVLEVTSKLTPKIKFAILQNKMRMKDTLLEYSGLNDSLIEEGKTAVQYDQVMADLDENYKKSADEMVTSFANNSPRWAEWKAAESSYIPVQISIAEFIHCENYQSSIVMDCHEVFTEGEPVV